MCMNDIESLININSINIDRLTEACSTPNTRISAHKIKSMTLLMLSQRIIRNDCEMVNVYEISKMRINYK